MSDLRKQSHFVERLLHERDAAEMLGMSIAWMQKARYLGTGPRFIKTGGKHGRAVRYLHADLLAYINENAVDPGALSSIRLGAR